MIETQLLSYKRYNITSITEISSDILFGPRKRNFVDPRIQVLKVSFCLHFLVICYHGNAPMNIIISGHYPHRRLLAPSEEMGLWSCLVFMCVLQPLLVHCSNSLVTCGSALKLQHVKTNVRLHSHEVNYGSGSGQQVGIPQALLVYCLYVVGSFHHILPSVCYRHQ